MAKKLGNDYRLWIEGSTPGTYAEVKGNQTLSITRSAQLIDTSGKSDFPYSTQAAGMRTCEIAASFVPDLPDANGFTTLETAALATSGASVNFQIRKGGSSGATPGDVVFKAGMYITDWNTDFGMNSAVKADCKLVIAGAPTTDALA